MLETGPTLGLQIINFIVLLFVLKAVLWKPLMEALESRKQHIEGQVREAEGINAEAKDLRSRYERQIADARGEAQRIVREATAQAEQTREQILNEAKEEASRIRKQAERDVVSEREKAMVEVKRHLVDLTVSTAAKVLQDSLDQPTQERLMADFVRKVGEKYVN